ncbi:MAG: glycosyltransferase family 2 protein [Thermoplasmata archaeon]|nr:glycosyltransferase family 2 protein [Thermoplasmata archaeon]
MSEPSYARYTLDRYNRTIQRVATFRWKYAIVVVALSAIGLLLIPPFSQRVSGHMRPLEWLTLVWAFPVPLILVSLFAYLFWFHPKRFLLAPPSPWEGIGGPIVQFQITSTGVNAETVVNTARSVLYWTRAHPEVCFQSQIWLVVEEWGYGPNREALDQLRDDGVRLIVVPTSYRTEGGALRKSRALQFSVQVRRSEALPLAETWVYHHDDETAIGEDTVLGIDEFLREHMGTKAVGMGIIIYPQKGDDFRASFVADFNRAKDDIRGLYALTSRRNVLSGFHGSHYIVRADVEEEVGYDIGENLIVSEDFVFEVRVRERFPDIFHILKGFAYEQSPLNLMDQIKQRRRWVWNLRAAWLHLELPAVRRAVLAYGLGSWMCAGVSTIAIGASLALGFGAIVPLGGFLAGIVWAIMVMSYVIGYELHREYVAPRPNLWKVVVNGIAGALTDGVSVWAGMLTRQKRRFEVVQKDTAAPPVAGRGTVDSVFEPFWVAPTTSPRGTGMGDPSPLGAEANL